MKIEKTITSLDWDDMVESYPFAVGKLQTWLLSVSGIDDAKVYSDDTSMFVLSDTMIKARYLHTRDLYDFFDSCKMQLFVIPHAYPECFFVVKSPKNQRDFKETYPDRISAELTMFKAAMQILNDYLKINCQSPIP